MNGDSRKKFDIFFRTLISGTDSDHPRPKTFKLGKVGMVLIGYYILRELFKRFHTYIVSIG